MVTVTGVDVTVLDCYFNNESNGLIDKTISIKGSDHVAHCVIYISIVTCMFKHLK